MQEANESILSGLSPSHRQELAEGDRLLIARIAVDIQDEAIDKILLPY